MIDRMPLLIDYPLYYQQLNLSIDDRRERYTVYSLQLLAKYLEFLVHFFMEFIHYLQLVEWTRFFIDLWEDFSALSKGVTNSAVLVLDRIE